MKSTPTHPLAWLQPLLDLLRDHQPQSSDDAIRLHDQLAAHIRTHGCACPPHSLHPDERAALATTAAVSEDQQHFCVLPRTTRERHHNTQWTDPLHALQRIVNTASRVVLLIPTEDGHFRVPERTEYSAATLSVSLANEPWYAVLAQVTACAGTSLELLPATVLPMACATICKAISSPQILTLPLYQWEANAETPHLYAVIIIAAYDPQPPLTLADWCRVFAHGDQLLSTLKVNPTLCRAPLLASKAPAATRWDNAVTALQPDHIPWVPPGFSLSAPPSPSPSTSTSVQTSIELPPLDVAPLTFWLNALIHRLGIPAPSPKLHPYALKQRLLRAMHKKEAAEEFSRTAESSAIELSRTARSHGWEYSVRELAKQLARQLQTPATLLTLFGRYHAHRPEPHFMMANALAQPLDGRQQAACDLLIRAGALQSEPRFVTSDDTVNPLYAVIRTLLGEEDAFALLPIYAWRGPDERPDFHGVVLMLFDPGTPAPDPVTWLQWQLFCQIMHTPIGVIGSGIDDFLGQLDRIPPSLSEA